MSRTEAEYMVMVQDLCELQRLHKLMRKFKMLDGKGLILYYGNKATINILHNPI